MGLQELAIAILPVATFLHGIVATHSGVTTSTVASGFLLVALLLPVALYVPRLIVYDGITAAPAPDGAIGLARS